MYIYVYIYMYICIYIYMYIYVYICIYIYVYTYSCMYICIHAIYIYICVCVCIHTYTHMFHHVILPDHPISSRSSTGRGQLGGSTPPCIASRRRTASGWRPGFFHWERLGIEEISWEYIGNILGIWCLFLGDIKMYQVSMHWLKGNPPMLNWPSNSCGFQQNFPSFWDLRDGVCPSPCLYDPKWCTNCTTLLAKTWQFFATYFRAHRYCRAGLRLSLDHCIWHGLPILMMWKTISHLRSS